MKTEETSTVVLDFFARLEDLADEYLFDDENDDASEVLTEDEDLYNPEKIFLDGLDKLLEASNYDANLAMEYIEAYLVRFLMAVYKANKEITAKSETCPVLTDAERAEYALTIKEINDSIAMHIDFESEAPNVIELKQGFASLHRFFKANVENMRQILEQRISEIKPDRKPSLSNFKPRV